MRIEKRISIARRLDCRPLTVIFEKNAFQPILDVSYEDIFDEEAESNIRRLAKLTRRVAEASHKYSIAAKQFEDDMESVLDLSFWRKLFNEWKTLLAAVCGTLLLVALCILLLCFMSYMKWTCCCCKKCK